MNLERYLDMIIDSESQPTSPFGRVLQEAEFCEKYG